MTKRNLIILVCAIGINGCISTPPRLPDINNKISPHNDSQKQFCNFCHIGNSVKLYGDPSELCLRCHPMGRNDHPVGVKITDINTWLPLGKGKTVECHTCHDQHYKTQNRFMLRASFNNLCKECHNKNR